MFAVPVQWQAGAGRRAPAVVLRAHLSVGTAGEGVLPRRSELGEGAVDRLGSTEPGDHLLGRSGVDSAFGDPLVVVGDLDVAEDEDDALLALRRDPDFDTVGRDRSPAAGDRVGQTVDRVWCFEGANGDSTWPANPNTTVHETFTHWSKFAPSLPPPSKWHVSTRHGNPGPGGTYNAWCGCPENPDNGFTCPEVGFWIFKEGSGDDWNYPLTLDMSGQNASAGGMISFDIRYDCECNYDYGDC